MKNDIILVLQGMILGACMITIPLIVYVLKYGA